MSPQDTLTVLKKLERGEINSNQADASLNEPIPAITLNDSARTEIPDLPKWLRTIWVYPLAFGVLTVLFGGWIIAATARENILWFLLGLPILLSGCLITAFAASAVAGHFLYVNVKSDQHGNSIKFGMPFPLGMVRLGLGLARAFGKHPQNRLHMERGNFQFNGDWADSDAFIAALERELAAGHGITVDVDDQNERVQVYIV